MKYKITANLNDWGQKLLNKHTVEIIKDFDTKSVQPLNKSELIKVVCKEYPQDIVDIGSVSAEWVNRDFKIDDVVRITIPDIDGTIYIYSQIVGIDDEGIAYVDAAPIRKLVIHHDITSTMFSSKIKKVPMGVPVDSIGFDCDTGLDTSRARKFKWKIDLVSPDEASNYFKEKEIKQKTERTLMLAVTLYMNIMHGNWEQMTDAYKFMENLISTHQWKELEEYIKTSNEYCDQKIWDRYNSKELDRIDDFDDTINCY